MRLPLYLTYLLIHLSTAMFAFGATLILPGIIAYVLMGIAILFFLVGGLLKIVPLEFVDCYHPAMKVATWMVVSGLLVNLVFRAAAKNQVPKIKPRLHGCGFGLMPALAAFATGIILLEMFRQGVNWREQLSPYVTGGFGEVPTLLYAILSVTFALWYIKLKWPKRYDVLGYIGLAVALICAVNFGVFQYRAILSALQMPILTPDPIEYVWAQVDPILPIFPCMAIGVAVGTTLCTSISKAGRA